MNSVLSLSQPSWQVLGVGCWLPGVPSRAAWLAGQRPDSSSAVLPTGGLLDKRTRRRASALCRALADAFEDAATQAEVPLSSTPSVFGSALGEVTTMLGVLEQMTRGEELSPMHFATSVHNTASGMVSISNENRGFTTSVSADYDTVAAALLEAIAVAQTEASPVVVVCGDERSPVKFVEDEHAFEMMTVALVLQPATDRRPGLAEIGSPRRAIAGDRLRPPPALPQAIARNPQVGLFDVIAAVLDGGRHVVPLDRGQGHGWVLDVDASRS